MQFFRHPRSCNAHATRCLIPPQGRYVWVTLTCKSAVVSTWNGEFSYSWPYLCCLHLTRVYWEDEKVYKNIPQDKKLDESTKYWKKKNVPSHQVGFENKRASTTECIRREIVGDCYEVFSNIDHAIFLSVIVKWTPFSFAKAIAFQTVSHPLLGHTVGSVLCIEWENNH